MRAVDLLVNHHLPDDVRDYGATYDAKGLSALMGVIAQNYPDKYEEVAKSLSDIGREASWRQGETIHLGDMLPVIDREKVFAEMDLEISDLRKQRLSKDKFEEGRMKIWARYSDALEKMTMKESLGRGNNLAYSVVSGARGKAPQLKSMVTTPGLYTDYKDEPIPLFVRNSFGDGLRPAEYLAGAFGARKSVISTKAATARGGDFAKQAVQSATTTVVTTKDCSTKRGLTLDITDSSLKGRVLAFPAGGYPAGTVLDRHAIAELRKKKVPGVVARSAITCDQYPGVCSKCIGAFYNGGKLPKIGDTVGITASQAIGEPITQSALNCLAVGTMVRMADYSLRRIELIEPGEWVLGADKFGNTFPVQVTAVWNQGVQPVYRYTYKQSPTKQLISVSCTEIHEILTATHYSNAKEESLNHTPRKLPAGRKAGKPSAVLPVSHTTGASYEEPIAGLLGFWMGDGIRWDGTRSIHLSCADEAVADDLVGYAATKGLHLHKLQASFDWSISDLENGGGKNTHILKTAVVRLGWGGKYCHEKAFPTEIWSWNDESVVAFIAGYWSADGSTYRNKELAPGVSFGSTSYAMLTGLKEVLAVRFGIYCSAISRTGKAGEGNRKNDLWQFTITRRDQLLRFRDRFADHTFGGKGKLLRKYIEEAPRSHFQDQPFYKAPRVGVEYLGKVPCFDISVDHEDQLFVLDNQLIVSNTKHVAGVASGKREYSGFDVINQIAQSPSIFPDRATVSENDGRVNHVEEAPQGGHYVTVGETKHYVPSGYPVLVNVGDRLEAGDQISDGIVDPGDIVRLRGLGEGRKFYAERLKKALDDSGMLADPRSTEILSRSAIDHVVIDDPDGLGGYLPDDTVSYNAMSRDWRLPEDARETKLPDAVGKFLQVPVLHYSIGTRITNRMADHIGKTGLTHVVVNNAAPAFTAEMSRLRTAAHINDDWLASQHTSHLKNQLVDSAIRGDDTDVQQNIHFLPRLAIGKDFAKNIDQTGKF